MKILHWLYVSGVALCAVILVQLAQARAPITPATWAIPAWSIDPANVTTCAGDNNTGTSNTCAANNVGPLLTYGELNARWGCQGNGWLCPRLKQNTTITFLSSQPSGTADMIGFNPSVENAAFVTLQGLLNSNTLVCTTTLGTVTAKNRATPQLLKTTFGACAGSIAAGQIIVDSTHSSVAWIWSADGVGAWDITQPFVPNTADSSFNFAPTLVDWTNATNTGDSVSIYTPTNVNLEQVWGTIAGTDGNDFNNVFVYHLNAFTPQGAGFDSMTAACANLVEARFDRSVLLYGNGFSFNYFYNDFLAGGESPTESPPVVNINSARLTVFTHHLGGKLSGYIAQNALLDGDIIIDSNTIVRDSHIGTAYIASSFTLTALADVQLISSGTVSTAGILWGPGAFNTVGRVQYNTGDAGFTTFTETGGLKLNSQTTACKASQAGGITIACNLALTRALLDTNCGTTANCCTWAPGGGSYCNYGP